MFSKMYSVILINLTTLEMLSVRAVVLLLIASVALDFVFNTKVVTIIVLRP